MEFQEELNQLLLTHDASVKEWSEATANVLKKHFNKANYSNFILMLQNEQK
tara:strand:- start:10387 stop:10539 length:153 start_codon:yes stop_codon:yes gene_type:complete